MVCKAASISTAAELHYLVLQVSKYASPHEEKNSKTSNSISDTVFWNLLGGKNEWTS
jgi:hypothetical protein